MTKEILATLVQFLPTTLNLFFIKTNQSPLLNLSEKEKNSPDPVENEKKLFGTVLNGNLNAHLAHELLVAIFHSNFGIFIEFMSKCHGKGCR